MKLKNTLIEIEKMHEAGVIGDYAVGGAVAANFFIESTRTEDVDIFVNFNAPPESLDILSPIYEYAKGEGWEIEGLYIWIGDWPVQFLPPDSELTAEAIEKATVLKVEGFQTRSFTMEYLMAIALNIGRPKDKIRLAQFLENPGSSRFDPATLDDILKRHKLMDTWIAFKKAFMEG